MPMPRTKLAKASPEEKVEVQNTINRLENIMVQRLLVTEDLFAQHLPLTPAGPQVIEEKKEEKKDTTKVIEHPASKDKKKETVNEKVGKKIAEKKKEEKVEDTSKSDYDKLHPTEEEKLKAFADVVSSLERDFERGSRKDAFSRLKFHLRSYGDKKHFATVDQMNKILDWIQSGEFKSRSPFDVMNGKSLTIMNIIHQVEEMIIEGKTRKEIRNFLSTYIINNKIEGWENTISTERGYVEFFQRTLQYLFDEDKQREIKAKAQRSNETLESIKENLYRIYKDAKKKD